jgi:hypothetical protein
MGNKYLYAHYCCIIQSSGTGKSRLLDELSKQHFLIPINLREVTEVRHLFFFFVVCYTHRLGFPPPDVGVREFLNRLSIYEVNAQKKSHSRACHFLRALFIHTKDVIIRLGGNREYRIIRFREFMSKGQRFRHVGNDRQKFYDLVVSEAEKVRILFIVFILVNGLFQGRGESDHSTGSHRITACIW